MRYKGFFISGNGLTDMAMFYPAGTSENRRLYDDYYESIESLFEQKESVQEIRINSAGEVIIDWFEPSAAPLIRSIWELGSEPFPIKIVDGEDKIYCG